MNVTQTKRLKRKNTETRLTAETKQTSETGHKGPDRYRDSTRKKRKQNTDTRLTFTGDTDDKAQRRD